jgi:hypothetical protein
MAIGCLANWLRNRTFHCAITGPLFLIGGVMFLLSGVRMIHLDTRWVWPVLLIGTGIAFLLEWLYGSVLIVEKSPCSLLLAAACGKTLFETLEQRGLAVLLVTKPLDSHRLTRCAAERLMPSAPPFPPKGKSSEICFWWDIPKR